jgi:hypothetical protein
LPGVFAEAVFVRGMSLFAAPCRKGINNDKLHIE